MKEKKPKSEVRQLDLNFIAEDDWRSLLEEWIAYRLEIKKPCTQRIVISSYNLLKRLSMNNIETAYLIVEQSEACGYQGIFPLKENYGARINRESTERRSNYQSEFADTIQRKMGGGDNK